MPRRRSSTTLSMVRAMPPSPRASRPVAARVRAVYRPSCGWSHRFGELGRLSLVGALFDGRRNFPGSRTSRHVTDFHVRPTSATLPPSHAEASPRFRKASRRSGGSGHRFIPGCAAGSTPAPRLVGKGWRSQRFQGDPEWRRPSAALICPHLAPPRLRERASSPPASRTCQSPGRTRSGKGKQSTGSAMPPLGLRGG